MANTTKSTSAAETKPMAAKDIDVNQMIVVRNGFQGKLIYISARTGEKFVWDEFGSEQDIELRELRNAKSAHKGFFENNWFMFDDDYAWVIDYLGVGKFYENCIKLDEFDDLFKKTPAQIKATISKLSDGQKKSVSYRARQLITSGDIDSHKAILALEEALGVELIER